MMGNFSSFFDYLDSIGAKPMEDGSGNIEQDMAEDYPVITKDRLAIWARPAETNGQTLFGFYMIPEGGCLVGFIAKLAQKALELMEENEQLKRNGGS